MSTREKLLALLNDHKGTYYSGEEIADKLGISRTAVWKAVKALQSDGYQIDAVRNKGYSLAQTTDILTESGIRQHLDPVCDLLNIEVIPTVGSTNALLRDHANAGAAEGRTVIANSQTGGRGRLGRSFYSPPDTGIYMSLLLRPADYTPSQAVKLTTMAAVAACEAIEAVSGRRAGIKWVNDIYMDGKKVSGILTEGSFDLETGGLNHIILGIGINAYAPREGFPEEIADVAGSVFPEQLSDGKNRLAAAFLNGFLRRYLGKDSTYAESYRARSLVIGRPVEVISPKGRRSAVALDVDGDCRLIVRYGDGTIEQLSSAEISVKMN